MLVAATNPLIIADRAARTPAGMAHLIELADLLQAAVVSSQPNTAPPIAAGRMNFPNRHPLNQTLRSAAAIGDADVILGLEIGNFFGAVNAYRDQVERSSRPLTKTGVKLITITAGDLSIKGNYQDFQRYPEVDLAVAGDAEATLPSLVEAAKRLITDDRRRVFRDRGAKLADASQAARDRARVDATYGWDAIPISSARVAGRSLDSDPAGGLVAVHEDRVRRLSRPGGPGRADLRTAHRAGAASVCRVCPVCARAPPSDAAVHRQSRFRSGTGRHSRVLAIATTPSGRGHRSSQVSRRAELAAGFQYPWGFENYT